MKRTDELERENAALRERLSRLIEANLLINESLDFETVLQGVLDSARSLTGSRYGVILVLDSSGQVQEGLSSGMTADENQQLWQLHGLPIIKRISTSSGPVRLRDFYSHLRLLGLPHYSMPMPVSPVFPFMAAPVLHRDETVANFYLADKEEGEEFTLEDEETLVMFASQAALVIANARRHRDEQRARADLEALVNTAPVGVLVFDAQTGVAILVNQEARRIIGDLHEPDRRAEDLLEELTVRRADGRSVSLEEFPLAQALQIGETVRGRGDRHADPRRSVDHHPAQRHVHPLGGGQGRVGGRDPTGHDAPGGTGTAAGGIPGYGEPRVAHTAHFGERLDYDTARPLRHSESR